MDNVSYDQIKDALACARRAEHAVLRAFDRPTGRLGILPLKETAIDTVQKWVALIEKLCAQDRYSDALMHISSATQWTQHDKEMGNYSQSRLQDTAMIVFEGVMEKMLEPKAGSDEEISSLESALDLFMNPLFGKVIENDPFQDAAIKWVGIIVDRLREKAPQAVSRIQAEAINALYDRTELARAWGPREGVVQTPADIEFYVGDVSLLAAIHDRGMRAHLEPAV